MKASGIKTHGLAVQWVTSAPWSDGLVLITSLSTVFLGKTKKIKANLSEIHLLN